MELEKHRFKLITANSLQLQTHQEVQFLTNAIADNIRHATDNLIPCKTIDILRQTLFRNILSARDRNLKRQRNRL